MTAPAAVNLTTAEDVQNAREAGRLTATNRTAVGDTLAVAWNATGLGGLLAAQETGLPEPTTTDRFLAAAGRAASRRSTCRSSRRSADQPGTAQTR